MLATRTVARARRSDARKQTSFTGCGAASASIQSVITTRFTESRTRAWLRSGLAEDSPRRHCGHAMVHTAKVIAVGFALLGLVEVFAGLSNLACLTAAL